MLFQQSYSIQYFLDSLQYSYLQRALLATIIAGIVCGIIGVFIILKGLSFLGAGIAHSCFAGGALSILLIGNTSIMVPLVLIFGEDNISFLIILLFGILTALIIGYINEKQGSGNNDTSVGIMFSFSMALAVLFVGLSNRYSVNIQSLLFGNALLISSESFIQLIIVSIIVLIIFFLVQKELLFQIFDEEMAKVSGIPVRFLNYLFLVLIAAVITVSLKAIGAILVFAMIVTPAAAAYQWTYKVKVMLILAGIFGGISSFIGIAISFMFDIPSGASIVLTVTTIFALSFVLSPKRRVPDQIMSRDQTQHVIKCKYCKEIEKEEDCPYCTENNLHESMKHEENSKITSNKIPSVNEN